MDVCIYTYAILYSYYTQKFLTIDINWTYAMFYFKHKNCYIL